MSKPSSKEAEEQFVYLFSSAPPDRPTYKRGVLNLLCYPPGHQVELSYRKDYLQPPIFEQRSSLVGRRGVFVFVDYKALGNDHEFTPIRYVKILNLAPKEAANRYLDTTRVHVRVELGNLIVYDTKWNGEIAFLPGRPKVYVSTSPGGRDYFYVLQARNRFPETSDLSQRDIWDQITGKVAKANSLSDCVFLSTGNLRPFKDGSACVLSPYGSEQKAYRLEPNNIYRLDLRVYYPYPRVSSDREIVVRSSSDFVSVSQPFATAHGAEDHSVLIACKRTIESSLATLVIDVGAKNLTGQAVQDVAAPTALTDVMAAKPRYLLAIEPSRNIVRGFVFLIFLGFLLSSTSKELYSDFVCFPELAAALSKTLGAICLAWAGFLAFRKLPSGGSG